MTTNHAVVCVSDQDLLDTVLRVAAAAGCAVDRVPDAIAARREAQGARLVVLDPAAAAAWNAARFPRHHGVVLVCPHNDPGSVYRHAVDLGAAQVIRLPVGQDDLVEAFADAAEDRPRRPGAVLAVIGGRGGAGASVFAAALGLALLRRRHNGFLIDCDPHGGGLDLVMGVEGRPGLRWSDMRIQAGRVSAAALRRALPAVRMGKSELAVLSCHRSEPGRPSPEALTAVLDAGRRAGHTVVCDLPRSVGDVETAVLTRAAMTVMVVPADVRSCAAARGLASALRSRTDNVQLVVRGPSPGGLTADDVAGIVRLPLLAAMRPQSALPKSLDAGDFQATQEPPSARRLTRRWTPW